MSQDVQACAIMRKFVRVWCTVLARQLPKRATAKLLTGKGLYARVPGRHTLQICTDGRISEPVASLRDTRVLGVHRPEN